MKTLDFQKWLTEAEATAMATPAAGDATSKVLNTTVAKVTADQTAAAPKGTNPATVIAKGGPDIVKGAVDSLNKQGLDIPVGDVAAAVEKPQLSSKKSKKK